MVASRSESVTLQTFSSHDFRATVGAFATGVTVVTTRGEEHAYGMTANAFSSVSLYPPLILVCVISGSEGADHITTNGVFAVNILSAEQEPLSRYFSRCISTRPDTISRLRSRTAAMSTFQSPRSTPNSALLRTRSATFAPRMTFLLGRQAMFGQAPPT